MTDRHLFEKGLQFSPLPAKAPKGNPYLRPEEIQLRDAVKNTVELVLAARTGHCLSQTCVQKILERAHASPSDLEALKVADGEALSALLLNILRPLHEGKISSPVPRDER